MIVTDKRKSNSVFTVQEFENDLQRDIDNLTEDELKLLNELIKDQESTTDMLSLEYCREMVSVQEWLEEDFFFGRIGKSLYDEWKKSLVELFEGNYHEAILTGSIGGGKTTFCHAAVCRMVYEISCLRSPQTTYGLSEGSPVVFANLGLNVATARSVVFDGIARMLEQSPFFSVEYPPIRKTRDAICFKNNIQILGGSSSDSSIIGMNVFGGIISEANFFDKKSIPQAASHARWGFYHKVYDLYSSLKRRMKSRFLRYGKVPGFLLIDSSKQTVNDFTDARVEDGKNDPGLFVRDINQWTVKGRNKFSEKEFKVLVGNATIRSRILEEGEEKEYEGVEDIVILSVPDDFREDFEEDVESSIREIAGLSTFAISSFIQNKEKIKEIDNPTRRHPFSVLEWDISQPGDFLWNEMVHYSKHGKSVDYKTGKSLLEEDEFLDIGDLIPKINPKAPRHIHIDPALTGDALGFCMGHISHYIEVKRRRRAPEGEVIVQRETAPYIVIDFIIRILPPDGGEIFLSDVRELIYTLSDHGYPIRFISYDSFQSRDSIQQLKRKGYRSETISVDASLEPYQTTKMAIYENRVDCYPYPPLTVELSGLEKDKVKNKVDHRANESKDGADGFCGVIHTLTNKTTYPAIPIQMGISETRSQADTERADWIIKDRHTNKNAKGEEVGPSLPFVTL